MFILGQCGIPWREALYELPTGLGHQLMACHWISLGLEIESPHASDITSNLDQFEQLSNRKHSWL